MLLIPARYKTALAETGSRGQKDVESVDLYGNKRLFLGALCQNSGKLWAGEVRD
tara:strand:+ start:2202 stop:2363 length:162 start_codon:yes stop_codon:yes gene_type:complete